jgi:mRNA interferase HicA
LSVTSGELERWLKKHGCSISPGKGGHRLVRLGDKKTVLPYHGKNREIATGTAIAIKKSLGLLDRE